MPKPILYIHIASGMAGMAVALVAFAARKGGRLHAAVGKIYFVLVTVACATALLLTVSEWNELWPFAFVAVATYGFAVAGFLARHARTRRGLLVHVVGLTASFGGMAIASVVNNFQRVTGIALPFAARLLPMQFLSTCVLVWIAVLVYRGRIPRRDPT